MLKKEPFENNLEKGENTVYQHFLLFPNCFRNLPKRNFNVLATYILSSANALNLEQSEILPFDKELKSTKHMGTNH